MEDCLVKLIKNQSAVLIVKRHEHFCRSSLSSVFVSDYGFVASCIFCCASSLAFVFSMSSLLSLFAVIVDICALFWLRHSCVLTLGPHLPSVSHPQLLISRVRLFFHFFPQFIFIYKASVTIKIVSCRFIETQSLTPKTEQCRGKKGKNSKKP